MPLDGPIDPPRLPWNTLYQTLRSRRLELENWPEGVPIPGKDKLEGSELLKGIHSLKAKRVQRLYDAIKSTERPLRFRRLGISYQ